MRRITRAEAIAEGWWNGNTNGGLCMCWHNCGQETAIAPRTSRAIGVVKGDHYKYCKGHRDPVRDGLPEWFIPNITGKCQYEGCQNDARISKRTVVKSNLLKNHPTRYCDAHSRPPKQDNRKPLESYSQRCDICSESKGLSEFYKNIKYPTGREPTCKACWGSYRKCSEQIKEKSKRVRTRNQLYVMAILAGNNCRMCDEADPIVLEFHHIDPSTKISTIAKMQHNSVSLERLQAEIDKCEILCANCHKRVTAREQGWVRHHAQV